MARLHQQSRHRNHHQLVQVRYWSECGQKLCASILDTAKRYLVVWHHMLRIGQPLIEGLIIPDNPGGLPRVGVAVETRK